MNKKVLSAILFSALFAGTGTFTSCIDTDEPAGIEELRGAKAELIRAKVAVEQADAAYRMAEAEFKKAEAALKNAEAEYKLAQVENQKLQNELLEIQNDSAKAELEQLLAKNEMELDSLKTIHETAMLGYEKSLALATREYEVALKQIEIAKALMSEEAQVAVSSLVADVEIAKADLAAAMADFKRVQNKCFALKAQADVDSAYAAKIAAYDLKYAKVDLAAKEATLAKYQSFMEKEGAETAEWRAEIEAIADSLKKIQKEFALIELAMTEAQYTDAYKAYQDTVDAAEKAYELERDTLANLALTEDLADTLLYYGGNKDHEILYPAGNSYDYVAGQLAGSGYMTAKDSLEYTALLKSLRLEHDSYTTERTYWLDSIAAMDATAKEEASELAAAVLENYTKALAKYNTLDVTTDFAALKTAAATAINNVTATHGAKAAGTALLAYYTALEKNGLELHAVPVRTWEINQATGATTAKYTSVALKTALADSVAVRYLVTERYSANRTTAFFTKGTASVAATASYPAYYSDGVIKTEALDASTALQNLQNASKVAFGNNTSLYAGSTLPNGALQNEYLHNVPTVADVKYVEGKYGQGYRTSLTIGTVTYQYYSNVGIYGYSLLANDDDINFVANNYKAIKADLKAAIDKFTAFVDGVKVDVKKAKDDMDTAWDVVEKAYENRDNYLTDATAELSDQQLELSSIEAELTHIKGALTKAVNAFLPEGTPYTDAKAFADWLAGEVKKAEKAVIDEEKIVAEKELVVKKVAEGIYKNSELLIDAEYEKARVENELAKAQEALTKAMAALATAEEIWNAAE